MTKDIMLKELSKFFENRDKYMDVSVYGATNSAPYTRQQIRKVFKSYKKMLEELRALPALAKVEAPIVKPKAKVALAEAVEMSKGNGE